MTIVLLAVEKGSLTGAAKALKMPLPTISRKVNELESHLGAKLLIRSTRKLSLTDAGRDYVAAIKRIMGEIAEAESAASGEYTTPRGELVVTSPVLFGQLYMLPIVTDFLAIYREINVQLLLSDRYLHLSDDHVDMAVRLGELLDSRMVATKIGSMETIVCASPGLLSARGAPKHPADLQDLPCVAFAGPASSWSFRDPKTKRVFSLDIKPRLSVTAAEAAVQAAIRGTGFTRVYLYHCAAPLRDGTLVQVLEEFDVAPIPVHLVHGARGVLPLKMRTFLDFAAQRLRSALAELR